MDKKFLGKKGEEEAESYLRESGYLIVTKNYRKKFGEIDIIAKKEETLTFIEVRSKSDSSLGTPEESIDENKKKRIRRNAKAYVAFNKYYGACQIDMISVVFKKNGLKEIRHYKNIFQ